MFSMFIFHPASAVRGMKLVWSVCQSVQCAFFREWPFFYREEGGQEIMVGATDPCPGCSQYAN